VKCSIIGASYQGRSRTVDSQECVNLYPEISASAEAKNVASLVGTPGLKLFSTTAGSFGCRGLFTTARDRLLAVIGNKLYEISQYGSSSVIGTLNTSSGTVSFAEIDTQVDPQTVAVSQVMLVDGVYGYILNTATNALSVIGGDYLPGTSVISQNGFFIQNLNNSNKFIYSNQYDGLTWEASLSFFTAESSPDPILRLELINSQIWLFGSKTIEIFNYTGDSNGLFERQGIGFIQTGTAGRTCVTTINGHVFWIGSNPNGASVVWHSGPSYAPDRVSTHAIEYIIGQMARTDDCVAMSYQQEGHQFAIFNFPTGNRTLCYDLTTQLWHERGDLDVSKGINNRHRAMYLTNYAQKIIVGDVINSNLYEWDLNTYTDNGKAIKRIRVAPHIHNERHRIYFHQLEIDMERGVGLQSGQGYDPQLMLRYSNDGGYSWSTNEIWQTFGKVGARLSRVRFNKLGMSRDRVFEISITDPVRVILVDARLDVTTERV
jgi:hypothetical protein